MREGIEQKQRHIILDLQQTNKGIKARDNKAIRREGLQDYMGNTLEKQEWNHKHSATTLLAILGLNWIQERYPTELEGLGDMKTLQEPITTRVKAAQKTTDENK